MSGDRDLNVVGTAKDGEAAYKLIKDKEAIVGNTRYSWEDNHKYVGLNINGEYKEIYVTERDGLVVIQIGNSDEGPKYIAYK